MQLPYEKSKKFAIRIIKLYKYLSINKKEFILSKQLLRSGTSIGANVVEGVYSISRKEFIAKLNISLKEANEAQYWIDLLYETEYLNIYEFKNICADCTEIIKLLTSILKSTTKK